MFEKEDTSADRHAKLFELIKDIRFAMFTTHRPDSGHLHSRPMTTQNRRSDDNGSLWFFMSRRTGPLAELEGDHQVNVSYADPAKDTYVSVAGTASIVEEMSLKEAHWGKQNEAWFPGGVTDPDLALVRVRIEHADYWDVKDNKLVQLYKMAKGALTGETPQLGEHGRVRPN